VLRDKKNLGQREEGEKGTRKRKSSRIAKGDRCNHKNNEKKRVADPNTKRLEEEEEIESSLRKKENATNTTPEERRGKLTAGTIREKKKRGSTNRGTAGQLKQRTSIPTFHGKGKQRLDRLICTGGEGVSFSADCSFRKNLARKKKPGATA